MTPSLASSGKTKKRQKAKDNYYYGACKHYYNTKSSIISMLNNAQYYRDYIYYTNAELSYAKVHAGNYKITICTIVCFQNHVS